MARVLRRDALKILGAGALAASGGLVLRSNSSAAADLRYPPENGAELRVSSLAVTLSWLPYPKLVRSGSPHAIA